MLAADTLIRSVLGIDPASLTDDEWVIQTTMALWAEARQTVAIAKLLQR